jgi:hypothetical protein
VIGLWLTAGTKIEPKTLQLKREPTQVGLADNSNCRIWQNIMKWFYCATMSHLGGWHTVTWQLTCRTLAYVARSQSVRITDYIIGDNTQWWLVVMLGILMLTLFSSKSTVTLVHLNICLDTAWSQWYIQSFFLKIKLQ